MYIFEVWCRVNVLIKKLYNDVINCGGVFWWNRGLIFLMCFSVKIFWLDVFFFLLYLNYKVECIDMWCL